MNKKTLKRIPVFVLAIIIFILSSRTQKVPIGGFGHRDTNVLFMILHVGEFGLFTMLLMFGFWPEVKSYYLLVVSVLYGCFDELHQYFVPTRYCDMVDIYCNVIGAIMGIVIYFVLISIIRLVMDGIEDYHKEELTDM